MISILSLLFLFIPGFLFGQKAERQVSFARESKPHSYYVEQAELWWKETQKDSSSEYNWYNYFRACRNAHGTADWNLNYLNCFENVYKQYKAEKRFSDAKEIKDLSILLAKRIGRKEYVDWVEKTLN